MNSSSPCCATVILRRVAVGFEHVRGFVRWVMAATDSCAKYMLTQQLAKVHKPVYKWINAQKQPLKQQTHRL
jgi:hypothetical protein